MSICVIVRILRLQKVYKSSVLSDNMYNPRLRGFVSNIHTTDLQWLILGIIRTRLERVYSLEERSGLQCVGFHVVIERLGTHHVFTNAGPAFSRKEFDIVVPIGHIDLEPPLRCSVHIEHSNDTYVSPIPPLESLRTTPIPRSPMNRSGSNRL